MDFIRIDKELCRKDGICALACPIGSIAIGSDGYPVTAEGADCIRCGHCAAICPHGALDNALVPMEGFIPAPKAQVDPKELDGLMRNRRSIRAFKDQALSRETLVELLDIARYAPTAKNTQQLSFIMLEDPQTTRAIAAGVRRWLLEAMPSADRYRRLHEADIDFALRGAPHAVIVLGNADSMWCEVDANITLSYLELAASARGVGACWAGLLHRALQNRPELAAQVGIPDGRAVGGAMMLGLSKFRYSLTPPRNPAKVSWL